MVYCQKCGTKDPDDADFCSKCGASLTGEKTTAEQPPEKGKSKLTAGLFAIFLGGFGVHKFYLGSIGLGILYLVFCWTYIPSIIGVIEGIIYLTQSDEDFKAKYG